MHKKLSELLSVLLAACVALCCPPLPAAAEQAIPDTIHLAAPEDLLALAEHCRLDSWSQGRMVVLDADLDMTGTGFTGIPTFGGVFQGQHHTISGLSLQQDGSELGLFRYVQQSGEVYDLTVAGTVMPGGSRSVIGGIAGVNAGRLQNLRFSGVVSGAETVGGIAGRNEVSGMVENCSAQGVVFGGHFIGGIVGDNHGVVRSCENSAGVNTTAQQNEVTVSDITMETLTGTETAADATDIGGIAGCSSGVLRACINRAAVGYQHIGYNIGGIVGSQTGYVEGCVNFGTVFARKEAGGIVGQLEPNSTLIYGMDTLQVLSSQLNVLQSLTNKAASDAEAAGSELSAQLTSLQSQVGSARSAVNELLTQTANGVNIGTQTITTDLTPILDNLEQRVKDSIDSAEPDSEPPLPTREPAPAPASTPSPTPAPEPTLEPLPAEPPAPQPEPQAEGTAWTAAGSAWPAGRSAAAHSAPGGEEASPTAAPEPTASPKPTPKPELTVTIPSLERSNEDNIIAARNDLNGSLDGLSQSVSALNSAGSGSASALGSDLRAITAQIGRISTTLANAGNRGSDDLVVDISDEDSDSDTEGKVYNCVNAGSVQADINAGGIAGAMAMENDLDPEDDLTVTGDVSANITCRTRAVVRGCENRGTVSAKKRCAGGIVGSMELGSVLECVNTGLLDAEDAVSVGGIAGSSSKTIRGCSVKCVVRGESRVGGIAGSGVILQDNRAMVRLDPDTVTEASGAIAGVLQTERGSLFREDAEESGDAPVSGNLFVPNETAPGAIDGISYDGMAQPISYEELAAREDTNEVFRTLTVRFIVPDGEEQLFHVPYGGSLDAASLPTVPARAGYVGKWEGLDTAGLQNITFDETFTAVYTPLSTAQASTALREDGRPVALLEGQFDSEEPLTLTPSDERPDAAGTWLESWQLTRPAPAEPDGASLLHYLPPEDAARVTLYLHSGEGWRQADVEEDGSYLVAGLRPGDDLLAAVQAPAAAPTAAFAAAGGTAVLLAAVLLRRRKKRRSCAQTSQ